MKKITLAAMLFGTAIMGANAQATKSDLELVGQQGVHYFFTLSKPWVTDQAYIERTFSAFCATKEICIAHLWEKGQAKPKGLPLSDKEANLEAATYQSNKNTKRSQMLWSCKRFPAASKDQCFS